MKVNKFSRMYLVGMICILLSGFFPYFRYRFTIQDVETLKQGYPLLNLKKLATQYGYSERRLRQIIQEKK